MLIASLLTGLATTFLTEFLTKTVRLQEDASTGLVFSSLFALGVLLATLFTRNAHIGIEVVMGNVDALHADDLRLVYTILVANVVLIALFFKEYKITTFDGALARSMGISTLFFNYLLMVQVSATAVGAFRAVGVLMVLAFIIGPPLMARLLTHHLLRLLLISMGLGVLVSIAGVALSRHLLTVHRLALSTGGVVVCLIVVVYAALLSYSVVRGRLSAQG
jgi:manganese/zinc/iron transport system permease protein